jgi:peptidyl-prolyl cis-trans isomerase-like 4
VKPPDNVLFVCKLNPVTTSEDLEIIFSRFGTIVSCEVIKDQKTKESLQYAFIEFDKPEDCEKAYFKMDNVLIDERRIHVDFSQSVSKIQWKPKGKGKPETSKDEEREQLRIKHPDDRRNDKYDLVFEEASTSQHKQERKQSKDKAEEQVSSSFLFMYSLGLVTM